jgi:hypothetical protein
VIVGAAEALEVVPVRIREVRIERIRKWKSENGADVRFFREK